MAFKDVLSSILKEKNMKASELSRLSGVSEASISEYLRGKKEPLGKQSIAIAKALEVSLDILWETGLDNHKKDEIYTYTSGIGRNVERIRKEKGLTQKELAEKAGIELETLSKIIVGEATDPKLETVRALARALNCTLNDFEEKPLVSERLSEIQKKILNFSTDDEFIQVVLDIESLPEEDKDALLNIMKTFLAMRERNR